jgi:hypothetical protein
MEFATKEMEKIQRARRFPGKSVRFCSGIYFIYFGNTLYEIKRFDRHFWTHARYGFKGNDLYTSYKDAKEALHELIHQRQLQGLLN